MASGSATGGNNSREAGPQPLLAVRPCRDSRRSPCRSCGRGGRASTTISAISRYWSSGTAVVAEIGARRLHDLQRQVERHLVVERQRPDRHAGHAAGILDHRRRHALDQHAVAFADIGLDHARGVEAARIVDDDRRLADGADEIEGRAPAPRRRSSSPMMTSTSIIRSTGEKKWMPMKSFGRARGCGERGDRQRRGVGAEDRVRPTARPRRGLITSSLMARSSNTASMTRSTPASAAKSAPGVMRASAAASSVLGLHAAARDVLGVGRLDRRLALVGAGLVAVEQHHVDAGAGADVGDAGAHEAGADDRRSSGSASPAPLAGRRASLFSSCMRDEQRADHRRRFLASAGPWRNSAPRRRARGRREAAAPRRRREDRAGAGIIVIGLAAIDGVRRREDIEAGRRIDLAAGEPEAVLVPWLDLARRLLEPALRAAASSSPAGTTASTSFMRLGPRRRELLALEQHLQSVLRVGEPRDALRAAGAGHQPDPHFRQAELDLFVVGDDAAVAGERQFEGAADAVPLIAATTGLPQVSSRRIDAAEAARRSSKSALHRRLVAVLGAAAAKGREQRFEHVEVGAAGERSPCRR